MDYTSQLFQILVLAVVNVLHTSAEYCYYNNYDHKYNCEDDGGLSGGAIFGITCAILAVVAVSITCVCACMKHSGSRGAVIQPRTVVMDNNNLHHANVNGTQQYPQGVHPSRDYMTHPPQPQVQSIAYPPTINTHTNHNYPLTVPLSSPPSLPPPQPDDQPPSYSDALQMDRERKS